jgi:hypothetical protein
LLAQLVISRIDDPALKKGEKEVANRGGLASSPSGSYM